MEKSRLKETWLDPVEVSKVESYILNNFSDAEDIEVVFKGNKYIATFYTGSDVLDVHFDCVILDEFTTSIEGNELDAEWINIVRECNECRTIDGWTYERDLVRSLEVMINDKKRASIEKAEEEYKQDVDFLNDLFKELKIEEEIEPRQF